ncbi:Rne/Rng family ribonuclease [Synechocystis sp. PCC 7509]|uniref:Rne/Rng family ribonuclease n=1 Tax=Synechocystis sp. PCC 7509 TaxID=927677 RepID=UPI0002AC9AF2|nr:Rne/Rng family ribonuclease [Synechocystis sp. PCC 7509]
MPKQIIIAEQHHIAAVFSEDQIQELVVATGHHQISDVYLGVVENVLPGIDAAFVNIGDSERNGFIHVTDLGPLRLKRTSGAITELLAPQQKVLVQVMKEPTGNKGPRLTGNITMPGRYVVLMPFNRGVNLSRRIRTENERNRLRALAILIKPSGMGMLVRTEAEGKPEEAIIEDLEMLLKQWESIQQEAQSTRAPALLKRDDDFIQRVLRDMYGADVNRIVVDSNLGLKRVKQALVNWSGGSVPQGLLIDHHRDRTSILEYFRINAAIKEALKPRVDLPSGGYVIIEPTEALTVVDVNSGSFTRSATARETVLWTNCEAATEIARQLRMRNIAGVIIVDFIDMDSQKDQLQVLEHFNKALKADKARPQIAQLSELGLVELTRKRQGQNIYELFGSTCPTCGGLGHIEHLPGEGDYREKEVAATPTRERISLAEVPERSPVVIPATREFRTPTPKLPETRETYSDIAEAFNNSDRNPVVSISDRSSYQEDEESDRRTRRRRHSRIEAAEAQENSLNLVNELEPEIDVDEQEEAQSNIDATSSTNKVSWIERAERTKPVKPEPIKPIVTPPEIVTVEMTPEQQDVYALMGVSPLVLLNRQVKNPKSAIVNVTLPGLAGKSAAVETIEATDTFVAPLDAIESDSDRGEQLVLPIAPSLEPVTIAPEIAPISAIEETPVENNLVEVVSEIAEPEPVEEPPRRRRRRSSATE